jgi:PAS domain S-box-containing protein
MKSKIEEPKLTLFESAQENALVEALFASIGDGAIATDEFGKIMRINAAALKILGYEEAEVIGEWFPRVVVSLDEKGEPIELIDRSITQAFLTGEAITEKSYYKRKNGTKVPVSLSASPIILDGKPMGAIILFRDVTLEYEIDRMKSDFISLASHQLRTPLSSINMYSQMLYAGYMGDVSEKQRAPLRTIIESAERMSQLINTLLNITRIENGTIVVSHKRVDMNDLSEEIVEELRIEAESKSLNFTFNPAASLPLVRTDRLIMKEILTNLISNAIKYTPRNGSVTVTIQSLKQKVEFRVADTGVGIPSYSKENIFGKFFRAPNVMRGETTGTGLGLYLVKGMAERLGADVWFDSELGKGSTFYLSLPIIS